MAELYGVAFASPMVIYPQISRREWNPILLRNEQSVRQDFLAKKDLSQKRKLILATSLEVMLGFLKTFPKEATKCSFILFDFPGFLENVEHLQIKWLDCDEQAGGAWQIAKVTPLMLEQHLKNLGTLSEKGFAGLLELKKLVAEDRSSKIQEIANYRKNYRQFLNKPENTKKKSSEKWQERSLLSLVKEALSEFETDKEKEKVRDFLLRYQLGLVDKKKFTSLVLSKDIKISLKKWMDSKSRGSSLYLAYIDYVENLRKRSWETILKTAKHVHPDDLHLLISFQPASVVRSNSNLLQIYHEDLRIASEFKEDGVSFEPKDPKDLSEFFNC